MHPWCCTVVQLHLSSSLILIRRFLSSVRTFLFFTQDANNMTLTNLQGLAVLDLYTFVLLYRYTIYTLYYATRPMYIFSLYIFLRIVRIFRVRSCRTVRFLESYTKFFKNMGCLYFLESFLNFQSPSEIGFSISLSYREIFVIFYFKTTFVLYRFRRVDLTGGGAVFPKLFFIKKFIFRFSSSPYIVHSYFLIK